MKPGTKVGRACQRCRRQKLKCDVQRPCTLCSRAGTECISSEPTGEGHEAPQRERPGRNSARVGATDRMIDRDTQETQARNRSVGVDNDAAPLTSYMGSPGEIPFTSRSTMGLVADAFEYHNASAVPSTQYSANTMSSAFPAMANATPCTDNSYLRSIPGASPTAGRKRKRNPAQSFADRRLRSVLPPRQVADLLVDNYFDQIHWFMLLFHQTQFRETVQNTYDKIQSKEHVTLVRLSVVLASMALSLRYVDDALDKRLRDLGVHADALLDEILAALRLGILEIMSQGCLESVQTCVLLGTYYLYHGEAQLAWPLCGCGLRIAQAIGLHRKVPVATGTARDPRLQMGQIIQSRKRCWWAIYEIETFCSMLYGFPLSISDADCDIEVLDTHDLWSDSTREPATRRPSLLYFKSAMSELSKIIKTALTELYSLRGRPVADLVDPEGESSLKNLLNKITSLSSTLHKWYNDLPDTLRLWNIDGSTEAKLFLDSALDDESVFKKDFTAKILRLQALTLHLAYNNTIIIIHRPILSHRLFGVVSPQSDIALLKDRLQQSIQACQTAALEMSSVGATEAFSKASHTYAVTFIALHLLAAGVTLSIMATLNPLSKESHEAKNGLRKLMGIHAALKAKCIVAEQGTEVLKKLISLVMAKEMHHMMNCSLAEEPILAPATLQESRLSPTTFLIPNVTAQTDSGSREPAPRTCAEQGLDSNTEYLNMDSNASLNSPLMNILMNGTNPIGLDTSDATAPHDLNYLDEILTPAQDPGWIWNWSC
ncbi:hypothetical protein ANO14919_049850 [Xylariales sp. No.14919]|nr:hypothetical protein ANO14919_049850 [Xylariales sp. No.14919]